MSARGFRIFVNGVLLRLILFRVASWCVSSIGDAGIKQKMHLFFSPLLQLVFLFEPFCFGLSVGVARPFRGPSRRSTIFMRCSLIIVMTPVNLIMRQTNRGNDTSTR